MKVQSARSREGAWIEISAAYNNQLSNVGRSREGAWIEMPSHRRRRHIGAGRSREGAWIEILAPKGEKDSNGVAPVRERGLKSSE